MQNALTQLGWASRIHAAMICFAFHTHHMAAALGAPLWHMEYLVAARVLFVGNNFHDFGNHVTAAFDHHPIADLHLQPIYLILVMKRCSRDRGAANRYRLERGYRRQLS